MKPLIKRLDIYAQPVHTYFTSRNKKTNKKSYQLFHGSTAGGVITVTFISIIIGYLMSQVIGVVFHTDDIYKVNTFINDFTGEFQE